MIAAQAAASVARIKGMTSLSRRVTGRHSATSQDLLDGLLEASRAPDQAFDIVERMATRDPSLGRRLVSASNSAGRRGVHRVTTVRGALVRLGLRQASEILLHEAERFSPTEWGHAA